MPLPRHAQSRFLALILLAWLLVFFLTRTALLLLHPAEAVSTPLDVLRIYGVGLAYDLAFLVYAALPLAFYLFVLCPNRLWATRAHRAFLYALTASSLFAMLFVATAEYFFWDEFGARFNFIAVDYLVYTTEVIDNIRESYPVGPLIAGLAVLAVALTFALRRAIARALDAPPLPLKRGLAAFAGLVVLAALDAGFVDQDFPMGQEQNTYRRELSGNGPYQFFAAFRNNEIDYRRFYATLPEAETGPVLREALAEPNATFLSQDLLDPRRRIVNGGPELRRNIILVTVERT